MMIHYLGLQIRAYNVFMKCITTYIGVRISAYHIMCIGIFGDNQTQTVVMTVVCQFFNFGYVGVDDVDS